MTTPTRPRRRQRLATLAAVVVLAAMALAVTRMRADNARNDDAEHDALCFAFPATEGC